jgi:hypothetical protein
MYVFEKQRKGYETIQYSTIRLIKKKVIRTDYNRIIYFLKPVYKKFLTGGFLKGTVA